MAGLPLIVCEQDGHWAVALRRELEGVPVRIIETRSLAECDGRLAGAAPPHVVALESTAANIDTVLEWLLAAGSRHPAPLPVVLAARDLEPYEDIARELGAVHFFSSTRQLADLLGWTRALAARQPTEHHPPDLNAADLNSADLNSMGGIMADLPWGD